MTDDEYAALAARLTDPHAPLPRGANIKTGAEAAASGRAFLLSEFGSEQALEVALKPGRPRLGGSSAGSSPTIRGRVADEDFERFKLLEERTGKGQSALVREAVQLLFDAYGIGRAS